MSSELGDSERAELEAWVWDRLRQEGFDPDRIQRALEEGDERALEAVRVCLPMDVQLALTFGLEASKPMREQIYRTQQVVAEQSQIVNDLQALPPVERRRFRRMQVNRQTRALLRMTAGRADHWRPVIRPRLARRGGSRRRRSIRTSPRRARAPGRKPSDEPKPPLLARPAPGHWRQVRARPNVGFTRADLATLDVVAHARTDAIYTWAGFRALPSNADELRQRQLTAALAALERREPQ